MSCKIKIEKILAKTFTPMKLVVVDDSEHHAGHAQAKAGSGGHYLVEIVSAKFEGMPQLKRHRLVHKALAPLLKTEIHALGLKTTTPAEAA